MQKIESNKLHEINFTPRMVIAGPSGSPLIGPQVFFEDWQSILQFRIKFKEVRAIKMGWNVLFSLYRRELLS